MLTSIIIPYYNHWDLTHSILLQLQQRVHGNYNIVLVNDGSTDTDCTTGVSWWQSWFQHTIYYYHNPENIGFGCSMNIGAKLAIKHGADILVMLSNDVTIYCNFIEPLERIISSNPTALIGAELIDYDGGWNAFDINGRHYVIPYLNGWFLACTPEVWQKTGGFDSIYGKYTYEDIDLSTNIINLGYNLVVLQDCPMRHTGGGTVHHSNPDRIKITEENRQKYYEKWKDIIPHIL